VNHHEGGELTLGLSAQVGSHQTHLGLQLRLTVPASFIFVHILLRALDHQGTRAFGVRLRQRPPLAGGDAPNAHHRARRVALPRHIGMPGDPASTSQAPLGARGFGVAPASPAWTGSVPGRADRCWLARRADLPPCRSSEATCRCLLPSQARLGGGPGIPSRRLPTRSGCRRGASVRRSLTSGGVLG